MKALLQIVLGLLSNISVKRTQTTSYHTCPFSNASRLLQNPVGPFFFFRIISEYSLNSSAERLLSTRFIFALKEKEYPPPLRKRYRAFK